MWVNVKTGIDHKFQEFQSFGAKSDAMDEDRTAKFWCWSGLLGLSGETMFACHLERKSVVDCGDDASPREGRNQRAQADHGDFQTVVRHPAKIAGEASSQRITVRFSYCRSTMCS